MKLRSGVIGLGRIGAGFDDNITKSINTHASAHYKSKNIKLISLCDVDSKKLKNMVKNTIFLQFIMIFKKC